MDQALVLRLVIIAQNSSSLISPSLSRSALSIISCNSASSIVSPTSFTTLRRFLIEIKPVLSSSNNEKTRVITARLLPPDTLTVSRSKNLAKSIGPLCSPMARSSVGFLAQQPKEERLVFNQLQSIMPAPSQSKRSKASLISSISSRGSPGFSQSFGLKTAFGLTADVVLRIRY